MYADRIPLELAKELESKGFVAEIARKEKEGDCALIRGIDRTINYVKEAMEE